MILIEKRNDPRQLQIYEKQNSITFSSATTLPPCQLQLCLNLASCNYAWTLPAAAMLEPCQVQLGLNLARCSYAWTLPAAAGFEPVITFLFSVSFFLVTSLWYLFNRIQYLKYAHKNPPSIVWYVLYSFVTIICLRKSLCDSSSKIFAFATSLRYLRLPKGWSGMVVVRQTLGQHDIFA